MTKIIFSFLIILITSSVSALDTIPDRKLNIGAHCVRYKKEDTLPYTGVSRIRYPFGKTKRYLSYEYGILNGKVLELYRNGQKECEGENKFGDRSGKWTFYRKDGSIWSVALFENGKRNGLTVWCYGNGKKYLEEEYVNDKKNGRSTEYNDNGTVSYSGYYENDKKVGEWLRHDEYGNISYADKYLNGKLIQ